MEKIVFTSELSQHCAVKWEACVETSMVKPQMIFGLKREILPPMPMILEMNGICLTLLFTYWYFIAHVVYRVSGTCLFPTTAMTLTSPCDVHKAYKARAREACDRLTSHPFTSIHWIFTPFLELGCFNSYKCSALSVSCPLNFDQIFWKKCGAPNFGCH